MSDPFGIPVEDMRALALFLALMGMRVSGLARDGHAQHGRGAVIVDTRSDRDTMAYYVADARARASGKGWPSEKIAGFVATYDPAIELVLIFLKDKGLIESLLVRLVADDTPTPRPGRVVLAA